MGKYKKKKFIINGNLSTNHSSAIYRGDDIKLKLKQLREGMGYAESDLKSNYNERNN